jgi:hypothetical protein
MIPDPTPATRRSLAEELLNFFDDFDGDIGFGLDVGELKNSRAVDSTLRLWRAGGRFTLRAWIPRTGAV